jgi:hypothetical protein
VRTLAPSTAISGSSFLRVLDVHEFLDGRVLVLDYNDFSLHLVDFERGTVRPVGRNGAGPGEYRLPERLFSVRGDSVLIWDAANGRMLVILPDGSAGGSPYRGSRPPFRSSDLMGYFYGIPGQAVDVEASGSGRLISLPLIRFHGWRGKKDTVALIPFRLPPGSQNLVSAEVMQPFHPRHAWAVSSDGVLAVVSPDPYRVAFRLASGRRTLGQGVTYDRIPLSAEHRQEHLDALRLPRPTLLLSEGTGIVDVRLAVLRQPEIAFLWPRYLPPFVGQSARFSSDGKLWVKRATAVGAIPYFDVFDQSGLLAYQVVLQSRRVRLVGFGKGVLYLIRSDDEDMEWLERYRLP